MSGKQTSDVIIIGGGHNGLTCAGYLARQKLSVTVLERRGVVGGAAVTEEFHPGFRNSVAAYSVSLLHPKVIKDLELHKYGLEIMLRTGTTFFPSLEGKDMLLGYNHDQCIADIKRFSQKDALAYDRLEDLLARCADVLREIVLETPPNINGGLSDAWRAGKFAWRLRKLSFEDRRDLTKLMTMSIGDFLEDWFETDMLKGIFGYGGIIGNFVSPYSGGSAYVLLHHVFGEVNGVKGAWGHAKGGMGAITQAMAKSAEAHGADIRLNAEVAEVIVEGGKACGVKLSDGTELRAKVIVTNTNPKYLFTKVVDSAHLSEDFLTQMQNYRCHSASFRMNLALDGMPDWIYLRDKPEVKNNLRSIQLCPSLQYLHKAYNDALTKGWADQPVIEVHTPSLIDNTLAPPGKHVISLFCQHFNKNLPDGRSWDDVREQVADHIIDVVTQYAPDFKSKVLGRQIHSPLDLERKFNLTGGDIHHGALHMDQFYAMRPTAGFANYRMPLGIYLCGAGAHPGGGVSGLPGHNAAREILADGAWR